MTTRPRGTTQLPVSGNTMSVQDSHSKTGPVITMERGQGVWRQPKTRAGGSGPTPRHRRPRRGRGLSGVPATQEHGGRGQPDDDPQDHNAVALSRVQGGNGRGRAELVDRRLGGRDLVAGRRRQERAEVPEERRGDRPDTFATTG